MSDTVVAIVSAFFVIGILVGIIIVVAIRAERRRDPGDLLDDEWDDTGPDRHPRWPGDSESDFSDR
jgi:hypothetical protein